MKGKNFKDECNKLYQDFFFTFQVTLRKNGYSILKCGVSPYIKDRLKKKPLGNIDRGTHEIKVRSQYSNLQKLITLKLKAALSVDLATACIIPNFFHTSLKVSLQTEHYSPSAVESDRLPPVLVAADSRSELPLTPESALHEPLTPESALHEPLSNRVPLSPRPRDIEATLS